MDMLRIDNSLNLAEERQDFQCFCSGKERELGGL